MVLLQPEPTACGLTRLGRSLVRPGGAGGAEHSEPRGRRVAAGERALAAEAAAPERRRSHAVAQRRTETAAAATTAATGGGARRTREGAASCRAVCGDRRWQRAAGPRELGIAFARWLGGGEGLRRTRLLHRPQHPADFVDRPQGQVRKAGDKASPLKPKPLASLASILLSPSLSFLEPRVLTLPSINTTGPVIFGR